MPGLFQQARSTDTLTRHASGRGSDRPCPATDLRAKDQEALDSCGVRFEAAAADPHLQLSTSVSRSRIAEHGERAAKPMKQRERDSRDEELLRLRAKLGEITMANELLEQKIAALEGGRPLGRRRSRR